MKDNDDSVLTEEELVMDRVKKEVWGGAI